MKKRRKRKLDDHLDITTLKHLYKSQPKGSIHFFAPLGNKEWFISNIGCKETEVSELDWQETRNLTLRSPSMAQGDGEGKFEGELRITAEECQHFTGVHHYLPLSLEFEFPPELIKKRFSYDLERSFR